MLLAGCGWNGPVGRTHEQAGRPTVVSLNPCVDAVLVEVADPRQVLALSHWSGDPASSSLPQELARRYAVTGGTVEEVLALGPDLVLASSFLDPATRDALDRLGVRVELFGIAGTLAESKAQVRRIAALIGSPAAGERLVGRMRLAVADAAPPAGAQPVDTVLWQPGGIVPGRGTLVAELLERTGFANGAAARGYRQADYLPLEAVVADPPELLLVAGHDPGQVHPVLDALPGMTRTKLDPALLYCGGPTVVRAAQRLAALRRTMEAQR
nr:ABC transporter substrate-binding protein [Porphyrobacter sp. GA68]